MIVRRRRNLGLVGGWKGLLRRELGCDVISLSTV